TGEPRTWRNEAGSLPLTPALSLSAPGRKFGDVFCNAGFQTCCLADFQIRKRPDKGRSADWKVGDIAGLETCVTSSYLRPPALRLPSDDCGSKTLARDASKLE